jgi:glycosyltransferase involved in cell wall biosynthesis
VPDSAICHCVVLIPTYNTGKKVLGVVAEVRAAGYPLIVVADGSTDGTTELLRKSAAGDDGMILLAHECNLGKGAALLTGAREALRLGYTHVLAFDADGQHPATSMGEYLAAMRSDPGAWVAGYPVFDAKAPWERVFFRKLALFWTRLLARQPELKDAMFGMRVYPARALVDCLESTSLGRRYDVECVLAIKLSRAGHPVINVATPVRYFQAGEGGVSHYHYLRDNVRLGLVFLALMPRVLFHRRPPRREEWKVSPPST